MVKFSLLKIERLDLLEKLFGKVMIPVAVYEELTADERYEAEAKQLKSKSFISVEPVSNEESVSILKCNRVRSGRKHMVIFTVCFLF